MEGAWTVAMVNREALGYILAQFLEHTWDPLLQVCQPLSVASIVGEKSRPVCLVPNSLGFCLFNCIHETSGNRAKFALSKTSPTLENNAHGVFSLA